MAATDHVKVTARWGIVLLFVLALAPMSRAGETAPDAMAALEAARRAQELAPGDAAARLAVGRILVDLGAAREALRSFAEARRLDPSHVEAYVLAAFVLRDVDQHEDAVKLLEEGLGRGVDAAVLVEELGFLLLAVGRAEDARKIAETALAEKASAGSGGLQLVLGLALAADPERRVEAVAWIEEALALGVANPGKARLELAALLLEGERAEDAIVHLREAERLLGDVPEVFYRLGAALRATGDLAGARQALGRYQQLSRQSDTTDWDAKRLGTELNEVQALATGNRLAEALERLEKLLEAQPNEDRALALQGKILFSMGKKDEALAAVAAARELMPSRVENHYLEGMFLTHLGRLVDAEAALRRAVALDAGRGDAHEMLGRLYANRGSFEEAAGHFGKALAAGTDGTQLRRAYAEVLKRLGRDEESEAQMEAWRRLGDD